MNFTRILTQLTDVIRTAGAEARRYFESPDDILNTHQKANVADLVTEADTRVEIMIVDALTTAFPDHHIVGEEGGGMGAPAETADYYWYVDPIDGTTNFATGIPHFSTSIALTDSEMNPLVGLVYDPMRDELFTAIQGQGAWLDQEPIQVSDTPDLLHAILASGFPYDKHTRPDNNLNHWANFVVRTRGVRRFGSAALDLSYVACGRFDGFWECTLNPWDVMAGILIVREAGGIVTDYQGSDTPRMQSGGCYIASNKHIYTPMISLIQQTEALTEADS